METQDNRKSYVVELYNRYGRYFQQVQQLTEEEVIFYRLKGYNIKEVDQLDEIYVRKFK